MSIPNLPVNFKDDILNTGVNQKRKYQQTYNSDGSVSFEDVTAYRQKGSNFGAQEVNKTNEAVNNIYSERVVDLDALELITEPGFFVDALAVKDAYTELNENLDIENVQLSLNTTNFTTNTTSAQRQGKQVIVHPYVIGVPTKDRTIATGLPAPKKSVNIYINTFGIVTLTTNGVLYISSAGGTASTYFATPFSYFAE